MNEQKNIRITELEVNNGQIEGLPKNPRFIKDERFKALKKSIEDAPEMLALRELLVYPHNGKYVVIGGNMRLRACKEIGYKEIPCKVLNEDTPVEKLREYASKDNIAFGQNDWDILANEWDTEELQEWGMELPDDWTGSDEETEETEIVEDEIPEDVETRCKRGDVWILGEHRLMCGDSTNAEDVEKLMNGEKADMVFTYPPYEIIFDYSYVDKFIEDANIFIFNNDRNIIEQLKNSKYKFVKFFVFNHNGCAIPQNGGNEAFLTHVLISHETKGNATKYIKGDGLRTVINGEYRRSEKHPHEKPQNLLASIIRAYSDSDSKVLDIFGGSGSTLIACEQLKRKCFMMELDPHFCDVIIARWEKLTGKTANKI